MSTRDGMALSAGKLTYREGGRALLRRKKGTWSWGTPRASFAGPSTTFTTILSWATALSLGTSSRCVTGAARSWCRPPPIL